MSKDITALAPHIIRNVNLTKTIPATTEIT